MNLPMSIYNLLWRECVTHVSEEFRFGVIEDITHGNMA